MISTVALAHKFHARAALPPFLPELPPHAVHARLIVR